jgi:formylmethanofuran:tetrahydromethanopterin formyltransferase
MYDSSAIAAGKELAAAIRADTNERIANKIKNRIREDEFPAAIDKLLVLQDEAIERNDFELATALGIAAQNLILRLMLKQLERMNQANVQHG